MLYRSHPKLLFIIWCIGVFYCTGFNTCKTQEAKQGQICMAGPLSLYKGCDQAHIFEQNKVSYGAENPGVFTDGACYLTWVAEQYGLKVDPQLQREEPVCAPAKGSRADVNRTRCFTNRNTEDHMSFCVFSRTSVFEIEIPKEGAPLRIILDKCKLFSVEG